MVRLSLFFLSLGLLFFSCNWNDISPNERAVFSLEERDSLIKIKYKEFFKTHQGTPKAMTLLDEILELDSTNAEAWRERSIPYLKRGYPHEWFKNYEYAIVYDAKEWIGWRGYNFLFFYKDFRRAISDFNATDTLTKDFIDFPQAMSVDFLRGIAYYGLESYDTALFYLQRYIDAELKGSGGLAFIDQNAFLYKGRVHQKLNNHDSAIQAFDTGLKIFDQSCDLHFFKSQSLLEMENISKAKSEALLAKKCFDLGYVHRRPYIEVIDQLYDYDVLELLESLKLD
tara:strand:+ start:4641 stop:5492 length:852 start_codon:yes stop_codon:yes gene_type:complete